eukprot:7632132-Alexandrium_andersonii.AAC.1
MAYCAVARSRCGKGEGASRRTSTSLGPNKRLSKPRAAAASCVSRTPLKSERSRGCHGSEQLHGRRP